MAQRKKPAIEREDWTGRRVSYTPGHPGAAPEHGTVTKVGTGKLPSAFVKFDNSEHPKLCYLKDLERID